MPRTASFFYLICVLICVKNNLVRLFYSLSEKRGVEETCFPVVGIGSITIRWLSQYW